MKMPASTLVVGLMLTGISAGLVVPLYIGMKKAQALTEQAAAAKLLYEKALSELQEDPGSLEKYQTALGLGRKLYAFGNRQRHPHIQVLIETRLQKELQSRATGPGCL